MNRYQKWVPGTQANQKGEGVREVSWKRDAAYAFMVLICLHSPFLPVGWPGAASGIVLKI